LLAFDDQRVVAGATRENEASFGYRVTAAGLAEVLANAIAVAPGLAEAEAIETRIGFRPMGPQVRPLLGAASNGLGAAGPTIGPFAGQLLADVALGRAGVGTGTIRSAAGCDTGGGRDCDAAVAPAS
jgi:D-amino-acid dehydrogenase